MVNSCANHPLLPAASNRKTQSDSSPDPNRVPAPRPSDSSNPCTARRACARKNSVKEMPVRRTFLGLISQEAGIQRFEVGLNSSVLAHPDRKSYSGCDANQIFTLCSVSLGYQQSSSGKAISSPLATVNPLFRARDRPGSERRCWISKCDCHVSTMGASRSSRFWSTRTTSKSRYDCSFSVAKRRANSSVRSLVATINEKSGISTSGKWHMEAVQQLLPQYFLARICNQTKKPHLGPGESKVYLPR